MTSTLTFCGRDSEFETLLERWHMACDVRGPSPQVVVVKAERGLGKTRLALEFYRWLNESVDGRDGARYWPSAVEVVERNLEVNPDLYACNFRARIPYLWWGLRAGDPGTENGVGGDAVSTYDRFLGPHLVALLVRARNENRVWEAATAWAEVGLDLAISALHVDDILTVGKGLLKTARILFGAINDEPVNEALEQPLARSEAILLDLEKVFNPKAITYAKTPGLIFLDDMQHAHVDAALPGFIERLIHLAVTQRWPVLILVTHTKAELTPTLMPSERSFAGVLAHAREGLTSDPGPAAGLPGGYLTNESFAEIDLRPIADLSTALREELPGLVSVQSAAILEHIGGNPRFLEQVIAFLHENENYFDDFNRSGPLTPVGFDEILKETRSQEIFKIVLRRLRNAPEGVQEAICMASLQGVRFANSLVETLAQQHLGKDVREALSEAEDPYCILVGTQRHSRVAVGQFAERLFYEVAQIRRQSLKSLGGESALQATLRATITTLVNDTDYPKSAAIAAKALAYGLAANLFERSADAKERNVAQRALAELAIVQQSQFSFESAALSYERLLAIEHHSNDVREARNRIRTLNVLATLYENLRWPARATRTYRRIFREITQGLPGGFDIFLHGSDQQAAKAQFECWKHAHPDWSPEIYLWAIRGLVSALLNLSELALAWPTLQSEQGDDTLGDFPFLVRVVPLVGESTQEDSHADHRLSAIALRERAYAQGGVLGVGAVEKEHAEILESRSGLTLRAENFGTTESLLLRALEIHECRGDVLGQIATLSNLGMVAGSWGNLEASGEYLERARAQVETILAESTFKVDIVVDEPDELGTVRTRKIGSVDVPNRFSAEFDADSDAVLRKVQRLKGCAANVYGNLATRARRQGSVAAAAEDYLRALRLHEEIGDRENAAVDLKSLGALAADAGDLRTACSYWRQCMESYLELERRNAGNVTAGVWARERERMSAMIQSHGCRDVSLR